MSDSDDIGLDKTESLEFGAQLKILHNEVRGQFRALNEKLDRISDEHTGSKLEIAALKVDIMEMKSQRREDLAATRERDRFLKLAIGAVGAIATPSVGIAIKYLLG